MINQIGIYVHIPFCATKCPYCDFYSVKYSHSLEQAYVESIITHMLYFRGKGYQADTLYFGGGTPSLIKPQSIDRIIKTACDVFQLNGEITLEANPNSVSKEKLSAYNTSGVNRLSFGMQSGDEKELSALGRTHSTDQVKIAVETAVECGIPNISLDLMLGTPYQTLRSLADSIALISSLPIQHVSAYLLKVEQNTPFYGSDLLSFCADEDMLADLYLNAVDLLSQAGFTQYEVSNFAKQGFESQHNLKYWKGQDYIGFGSSAHSHLGNQRFFHPNDIHDYIKTSGLNTVISDANANSIDESIMLNLRLASGLNLQELAFQSNIDKTRIILFVDKYVVHKLATLYDDVLSLTPSGFLISNSIIADLSAFVEINMA